MWKTLSLRIPIEDRMSFESNVRQESRRSAAVTNFHIAVAFGPAFYAIEKVARMGCGVSG
jgi:hypothetical protein